MSAAQTEAERISADMAAGEPLYEAFVAAAGSLTLDRRPDVMLCAARGVMVQAIQEAPDPARAILILLGSLESISREMDLALNALHDAPNVVPIRSETNLLRGLGSVQEPFGVEPGGAA